MCLGAIRGEERRRALIRRTGVMLPGMRDQDNIDHALRTLTGRIPDDIRPGVVVMDGRHAA
jgi:hypothetical protein